MKPYHQPLRLPPPSGLFMLPLEDYLELKERSFRQEDAIAEMICRQRELSDELNKLRPELAFTQMENDLLRRDLDRLEEKHRRATERLARVSRALR